jgi:hypothetical protein
LRVASFASPIDWCGPVTGGQPGFWQMVMPVVPDQSMSEPLEYCI